MARDGMDRPCAMKACLFTDRIRISASPRQRKSGKSARLSPTCSEALNPYADCGDLLDTGNPLEEASTCQVGSK